MAGKTRRKSKAAAPGPSEGEAAASDTLVISIPDDLDVDALATLLPADTNVAAQNGDSIVELYRRLLDLSAELDAAAQQRDNERAQVERLEVERDQALQDKETFSRDLEGSTDHLQREVKQLMHERDELATSKAALQAQLSTLSTSQSSSSSEAESLKHRLEDTEREKRDLVGVISRLKQDSSQRDEEIHALRANLKEARQDHQTLESQLRELRSSETATKFKLESLAQQLALSQAEAERANAELVAKSEEYSKQRRAKHAELVTLQANFDALTQTHASTQVSLKSLQSSSSAQSHQLNQALTRIQDLTGQLAEQENNFAAETQNLNRLVAAMQAREARTKEVVDGIEDQMNSVHDKADRREASLKEDLRQEREAREEAEKRIEQLEEVVERMGRGDLPVGGPRAAALLADGIADISPTVAMVSKAQKTGKTFTEVYTDYVRLQEDYTKKCTEYDRMDQTLSAVLSQIEERAPILSQQRAEYERLQSEAAHLASQLSQAISDRDSQARIAQENSQKLASSTRENEVLQQQLTDLGRQVKHLTREVGRLQDPSIPADTELEWLDPVAADNIDQVITDQLVLFRSVGELQTQNQKLLRVVRDLGFKMESEEKEYREAIEREQGEAVREAHEAMQELAEQLDRQKAASDSIIKAYVKERDTYKALLEREKGTVGNGMHVDVVNGFGTSNVPLTSGDLAKELAEVQTEFEAYRTEMGVDSVRLREDLLGAQREVGQLHAALAKANARNEYLNDRQRMNDDQFSLRSREVEDLTKRNQQLFDQWTRLDIECSRVSEDLQTANGRIEQLRNECANLRAEKKIFETVHSRLVDENKTLALERSQLSDLMGNVQKMHNDLEKSGENDRRRLENQLQMLEAQTQDMRHQLSKERDTVRHVSLQKDLEIKELQARLDKTTQEFAKARESLIGAETSKTHLEQRVEDLSRQIKGSEEKLSVYERRSSTVTGIAHNAMDQDLPREQQLEAEVAELRSALKIAEVDLATARGHVDQYRQIAETSEAALTSLSATYDEYKASTEAEIARHQSEYNSISERLKGTQQDLQQFTAKYNELLQNIEAERKAWKEDKKMLEDTIAEISSSEQNSVDDRTSRENQIRQLEERARALRRPTLDRADDCAWALQKEALDKELSDLNRRCQELTSQNSLLHQHLESVSSQAARIRQTAADSSASTLAEGDNSTDDADTKMSELRSVVSYLRSEKEIVELQLNLSKQECTRLKAQIEHVTQSLNDVRATLSEERERAVEAAASAAQHAELIERTNQINVLRESNATLRVESENHAKKARELDAKLKSIVNEFAPVKEEVRTVKAELEARDGQIKRLEDENRRWQERNSQLLVKYDRIDPAEMQAMKDEAERLKAKVAEMEKAKADMAGTKSEEHQAAEKRVGELEASLRTYKEHTAKMNQQFKERMGVLNKDKSSLLEEKKTLTGQVTTLETEIQALRAVPATAPQEVAPGSGVDETAFVILKTERDLLLAEKASWESEKARLESAAAAATTAPPLGDAEATAAWEQEKAALEQARAAGEAKIKELEKKVTDTKTQHDNLLQRARGLAQEKKAALAAVEAAKAEAAQAQAAVAAASSTGEGAAPSADVAQKHADELKALQQTLTTKHATELKAAVDAVKNEMQTAVQAARAEAAAAGLTGAAPDVQALIAEAIAKHDESLTATRKEEIAAAIERGRQEANAKTKLKDSQLVKTQGRVKDLEAFIQTYRESGAIPADAVVQTLPRTVPPVASTSAPKPAPTTAPPATATSAAAAAAGVPPKPATAAPVRGAAPRGAARGRGRGAAPARGGAAAAGAARVAAAATNAAASSTAAPGTGEISIAGAAKRPREESTGGDDGSLAKRIKQAPDTGVKPPVLLRRPPPPTAPPS
ncbi:hypothetical protein HMN09_00969600 [Mycena chlorophos]|uniref:Nucleoprotein TPR/MLP1 domain-containing protein n=1 Tax=Mycena chlorophos TaxID=658473 RepID=A0A8H6VZN8_MYCCL|nr:hypothetical protein HMN09_00969600 [Mycena chlorophos]